MASIAYLLHSKPLKIRVSSRSLSSFLALHGKYFVATTAKKNWGRLALALALFVLALVTSCNNDKRPPRFPVGGQVFVEGKPAHKAIVWFHPVDPVEPGNPRPRGVVDETGEFRMGTYDSKDGVAAGKYRVSISWTAPVKSGDEDGPSLVPLRYQDPSKSGIAVVEVQTGPVTLPAFQLTKQ